MKYIYNSEQINLIYNNNKISSFYIPNIYEMSRNLFDVSKLQSDKYTDPIPVISGQTYKVYKTTSKTYNTMVKFLDSNKEVIDSYVISGNTGIEIGVDTKYKDTKYIQVLIQGSETDINNATMIVEGTHCYNEYENYNQKYKYEKTILSGKRWLVLGDSISTGNGENDFYSFASEPYHFILAKKYGMIVTNKSVSGYTTKNLYENKVNKINIGREYTPDLITIFIGTNDCSYSVDLITPYKAMLDKLKELYPLAKIGLICPIDRQDQHRNLPNYVSYVENIAKEYNLPCLNMYKKEGWEFTNPEDINTYTCVKSDGTHDGLHPNNLGHSILVNNHIEQFIINLMST